MDIGCGGGDLGVHCGQLGPKQRHPGGDVLRRAGHLLAGLLLFPAGLFGQETCLRLGFCQHRGLLGLGLALQPGGLTLGVLAQQFAFGFGLGAQGLSLGFRLGQHPFCLHPVGFPDGLGPGCGGVDDLLGLLPSVGQGLVDLGTAGVELVQFRLLLGQGLGQPGVVAPEHSGLLLPVKQAGLEMPGAFFGVLQLFGKIGNLLAGLLGMLLFGLQFLAHLLGAGEDLVVFPAQLVDGLLQLVGLLGMLLGAALVFRAEPVDIGQHLVLFKAQQRGGKVAVFALGLFHTLSPFPSLGLCEKTQTGEPHKKGPPAALICGGCSAD